MPDTALEVAVRLLARREHSKKELWNKLKQRGFDNDTIDEALLVCETRKLQSDARFAEMLCRARIQRGYGPTVIRALLREAGVLDNIISTTLETAEASENWREEIQRVWLKKFGQTTDVPYAVRQKQKQFLRYRGFTEAMIHTHFETLFDDE